MKAAVSLYATVISTQQISPRLAANWRGRSYALNRNAIAKVILTALTGDYFGAWRWWNPSHAEKVIFWTDWPLNSYLPLQKIIFINAGISIFDFVFLFVNLICQTQNKKAVYTNSMAYTISKMKSCIKKRSSKGCLRPLQVPNRIFGITCSPIFWNGSNASFNIVLLTLRNKKY